MRATRCRSYAVFACMVFAIVLLAFSWHRDNASAYSYSTSGYYLSESDGDNYAYSYHTVQYGDWTCGPVLGCSIPITGMLQYVNVWYTQFSFSCWYQEVFTFYLINSRKAPRTTDYYSTPWYNWQYSWGYGDNPQGDQGQIVSIGDESEECYEYGAGSGLHIASGIVRNSTTAYTWFYGW